VDPEGEARVEGPPDQTELSGRHRRGRHLVALIASLVVVLALAVAAGGAVAARHQSGAARYRSTAVLLIDQEPGLTRARDNGIVVKLSTLRIKYVDLLTTAGFARQLAATLSLPPASLAGALGGVAPPQSLLLSVSALSPDRARARVIAQGAADKLAADLDAEQTALHLPTTDRVTLTVVTPAAQGAKVAPLRQDALRQGAAAGGVVLVLGLGLILLARRRR
jgi:hypothetical protein